MPQDAESPEKVILLLKETIEMKNKYISLLETVNKRLEEENEVLRNPRKRRRAA